MKKFQGPITEENFDANWTYVNAKIAEAKRKKIVEILVKILGNLTFLFCSVVVSYGVLHTVESKDFVAYLKATPVLADIWQNVEGMIYQPQFPLVGQIVMYILPSFVVTALVCGVLLLLAWLIYRPKPLAQRSEDMAVDSKELYHLSRIAVIRAGKPKEATSAICMVIYMVAIVVYVLAYLAISGLTKVEPEVSSEVVEVTDVFSEQTSIVVMMLILMGVYLVASVIAGFMMKLFYFTFIPKNMVADAESYYYEHNELDKIRAVDEERILALAREIKAQRHKEDEELLRKGKKKYEFFKLFEFQKKRDQEPDQGTEETV